MYDYVIFYYELRLLLCTNNPNTLITIITYFWLKIKTLLHLLVSKVCVCVTCWAVPRRGCWTAHIWPASGTWSRWVSPCSSLRSSRGPSAWRRRPAVTGWDCRRGRSWTASATRSAPCGNSWSPSRASWRTAGCRRETCRGCWGAAHRRLHLGTACPVGSEGSWWRRPRCSTQMCRTSWGQSCPEQKIFALIFIFALIYVCWIS